MAKWVDVCSLQDLADDQRICTNVDDRAVVICRVDDQYHAFANSCPHAGLPLCDGDLRRHVITCPYHGYTYNIKTGRNVDWPQDEPPIRLYPVRLRDTMLQIDIDTPPS